MPCSSRGGVVCRRKGLVYRLAPTPRVVSVLLRPELVNAYGAAVIHAARNHPLGIGAVAERDVVAAEIPLQGFERLPPPEEKTVLEATVELLIQRDLSFREMGLLVFPSQINVTRPPPAEEHPPSEVTYRFGGGVESIYASLVVRLSLTDYFRREDQWRYAVEFSRDGHRLGFAMRPVAEGTGELEVYFYPGVSEFDRVTFIRFVTDHLRARGVDIEEHIRLFCPSCGKEVEDRTAIEARVQAGKLDIPCQYCETPVLIPRSVEERYRRDERFAEKHRELERTVEARTEQEVQAFRSDRRHYGGAEAAGIHVLHLSDVHLGTKDEAEQYRVQLEADLTKELGVRRLEYLVVSGDVADHATAEEYEAAFALLDPLVKRFGLDASRVVLAPGNHDLSWDLSEAAYDFVPRRKLPTPLPAGRHIPAGDAGALLRDETRWPERFGPFASFYKRVRPGTVYPLDAAGQALVTERPDDRVLFLALNSAWEIDHHEPHRTRAGVHPAALAKALAPLLDARYEGWLKVAVWHHPVTGPGAMNGDFLEQLAVHGFAIALHGHVHEAKAEHYHYDTGRGLRLVGAGTFGAKAKDQVRGVPHQYNLLHIEPATGQVTVHTRRKEKPLGAWSADPRWGDRSAPLPRYTFTVRPFAGPRGNRAHTN